MTMFKVKLKQRNYFNFIFYLLDFYKILGDFYVYYLLIVGFIHGII